MNIAPSNLPDSADTLGMSRKQIAAQIRLLMAHIGRISGRRFWMALLLLLFGSLTEGISIFLLIPLLHIMSQTDGAFVMQLGQIDTLSSWLPDIAVSLPVILALLIGLVSLQAFFVRWKSIYLARMLIDFLNQTRIELFDAIARARWEKVAQSRKSELEHALTADIEKIQACGFFLLNICQTLVVMSVYAVLCLLISVPTTLIVMVVGAILYAGLSPFRVNAAKFGVLTTRNRKEQYRTISDFLSGIKMAKMLNGERFYFDLLDRNLARIAKDNTSYVNQSTIGTAAFQIASAIGLAVFAYVSLVVFRVSMVEFLVLLVIFVRVTPRLLSLHTQVQQFLVSLPAYGSVLKLTREFAAERELAKETPVPISFQLKKGITLKHVSYCHEMAGRNFAMRDISLEIPAGEVTALIGPSGAGKSTLADIIAGLIEVTSGAMSVDGMLIGSDNQRAWRSHVAIVHQDVFLLHDTIRANLLFSKPDADEAEISNALDIAQALEFTKHLPLGLDTIVGERGGLLSGGERQRIAIACAVLRKPKLLVLDEATSALDWVNQALIAETIEKLRGDTTILTIDHGDAMIAHADHIIAMEEGRLVDSGKYSKLRTKREPRLSKVIAG